MIRLIKEERELQELACHDSPGKDHCGCILMVLNQGRRSTKLCKQEWLHDITNSMDINLGKPGDGEGQESLALQSMRSQSQTQLGN